MFDHRAVIAKLGPQFHDRAGAYDAEDRFVSENYTDLKSEHAFSAMIPPELGGGGLPYSEMCNLVREISHYCSSTALAFSMHQHAVASAVWNYRHGNPGEKLLRRVASADLVLVSTGATDWLSSNGELTACDGGFRFTAAKRFASGSPAGDLIVTSGRFHDPESGWQVLHFALSMHADGVRVEDDWKTMGMRATGSHTVTIENAFVPSEAVTLRRPMGKYHRVYDIVLPVAMPLIGAAYVGLAEAAARTALESATGRCDDLAPILIGEMHNHLTAAQLAHRSMVAMADNLEFQPSVNNTSEVLTRKTLLIQATVNTCTKAMEVTRGAGYFRKLGLERLLRDAIAGQFHPLSEKKQQQFTGRIALGLNVEEAAG
ncbi:MAG TPA: acyl-CoA dehydrogenase family protein [Bryobacteraceae bacterium]|nr:acyl-CoA dehydrogenase family protein [Bryobacteraceae bacterium]